MKLNLRVDFEAIIFFLPLAKHLWEFFKETISVYMILIQIIKFPKINCLV